jgi:hypothetical protein
VPEVDRCDATSKSPPSKLRADATQLSGLVRALLMQNAEQQITEKRKKLLHAIEVLIAALSDRWEILNREQGRGQRLQPGGSLLRSCNWGWLIVASSPAEAYHPAVADHRDIEEAVTRVLDACRQGR